MQLFMVNWIISLYLFIDRYVSIIKYLFKIVNTDNILLKIIYEYALQDSFNGLSNWVQNVKSLLNTSGFSNIFTLHHSINVKSFLQDFEERVLDTFITDKFRSVNTSTVLDMYKNFRTSFEHKYP